MGKLQFNPIKVFPEVLRTTEANKINFIERIKQSDNDMFFNAVVALTCITKSPHFDVRTFNAMDKVCQMIYHKHKEIQ